MREANHAEPLRTAQPIALKHFPNFDMCIAQFASKPDLLSLREPHTNPETTA
jgi:hypothetical protein